MNKALFLFWLSSVIVLAEHTQKPGRSNAVKPQSEEEVVIEVPYKAVESLVKGVKDLSPNRTVGEQKGEDPSNPSYTELPR